MNTGTWGRNGIFHKNTIAHVAFYKELRHLQNGKLVKDVSQWYSLDCKKN